jgi:uncharacterized protein
MIQVDIRVYATLNDFLPQEQQQRPFTRRIPSPTSVKDLLEGAGVPHPEVGAVLIDDEPAIFERLIEHDCRVAAYPEFMTLQPTELPALRPALAHPPRFLLDVHLGRLARYLRMLGFDTHYNNAVGDDALVEIAAKDERVLLTRDRELLMRRAVTWGCFIRHDEPWHQLGEVVRRYKLAAQAQPLTRCMTCNGLLDQVAKAEVEDRLEPITRRHFDEFWQCGECGNVYWQGSHYARLQRLIAQIRDVDAKV